MKKLIFLLTLLIATLGAQLHAQKLTAQASKTSVAVGEPFQVTFSLNGSGTDMRIAHINDFDIYQGPYNSSSMSVVNGVVTQSYSLTYVLGAKKEGKFLLGPATINVNGNTIQSNTLTIEVSKASAGSSSAKQGNPQDQGTANRSGGDNLFLTVQPSKTRVYVGEELTLIHKLYYKVDIVNYSVSKMPAMDGCFVQDGKPAPPAAEMVDGERYMGGELKKTYVVPQRTGKITIEPMEADFIVRQQSNRRPRDIFEQLMGTGYEEAKYKLRSKPVTIEVLPLPEEGKPANFSGAVGNYTFKATLSKDRVKANEAINLTITISGKGNIKLVDPLKINFPEDFETYDPKITQNTNTTDGLGGTKTFDYLLIPRHEGTYKIDQLEFSFFDPAKKAYVVLPSPEFTIHVEKGDPRDAAANVYTPQSKEEVKVLGDDIRYIKTNKPQFRAIDDYFFGSFWFYTLLLLPVLIFITFVIVRKKNREKNSDLVAVKERKATKMARKRLLAAERNLKLSNKEQFYVEISQALYGYVSDKLNISVANLTKENISNRLRLKGAGDATIAQLIQTIDTCEYARYAPNAVSGDLHGIYNKTVELITKLENEIK
jgi:hypothetical protein